MSSCHHLAWLRHVRNERTGEVVLEDTGRLSRVIKELPKQASQTPQIALFIGTKTKDAAVKQIFSRNNIGRRGEKGNVNLRLDTVSINSDAPLLFAESSPSVQSATERSHLLCHETVAYPTRWEPSPYSISDIIFSRLYFLFCDVVCMFADDFSTQADVAEQLMTWIEIGGPKSLPEKIRPRLLIVISESSPYNELLDALHLRSVELGECFSVVRLFRLAGDYLSPLARYQRLRDEVYRQREEVANTKNGHQMLFSAVHLMSFFEKAVQHTARTISQEFNFIAAARCDNMVESDYLGHLKNFITLSQDYKTPYDSVASCIASSIIMDAYPPRMHSFSIQSIFSTIYKPYCYKALQDSYNSLCARHMCGEIERHCCDLFEKLQREYISSSRLHWGNMRTLDGSVALFRSNKTCLHCLRRPPERHLSCGHSICDECIRIFGTAIPCREGRIRIRCIYDDGNLLLDLKPRTAGARIMAIDGGGSRGVTPLEFMKELQKLLQDCPLHEMVDVACGSSSGGLITLAKFHLQWPIERCVNVFESFVVRCFGGSNSIFGYIKSAVNYITTDAMHDETTLESLLQEAYTPDKVFFGYAPNTIPGTRIAITAMTHGGRRTIFTNYNGLRDISVEGANQLKDKYMETAYAAIRPRNVKKEPLLWQVARATSAAPGFFKPANIDTGEFWDGALGFPNPTDLGRWEASRIWPDSVVDVVVSLGTGEEPKRARSTNSRTRILDTFNLLTDGQFHFLNMKTGSKTDQTLLRLNTQLPRPIRLDATDSLQLQRDNRLVSHFTPNRISLPIKPNDSEFEQIKESKTSFCKGFSPWIKYTAIKDIDGRGKLWLVQDKLTSRQIFTIKQQRLTDKTITNRLIKTSHVNLVNLQAAFLENHVISFVYDTTRISLAQLRKNMDLEEKYISYICREVLHGLRYFHRELGICCLGMSLDHILLTQAGGIKIGNVGSYMLRNNQGMECDDVRSLGFIMMEIMEPETASSKPNVIVLMKPELWSREIRSFQSMTQQSSIDELLTHIFMAYGISQSYPSLCRMVAMVAE
ncbi:hypothetical protein COH21_008696 [Aspergillus flavus]|nr:hypothetical protein COH21_008696 [Aspergillus flavus]